MNEVIGQYQLTSVLGGGGMATVYRAEHRAGIGMIAAVKKLHPHLAADANLRARLKVEAQALARLEHVNIVRILDYVDEPDACALVTELVAGTTLRRYIENDGQAPMPIEQSVALFRQMLAGVGHAHEQHCLHRDLKPGNVMVTPDGVVKVLDFGIATLIDTERMTKTGVSIGTPVYMAPEQLDSMEGLDERADVYALGVTLWEMLAGPNARTKGQKGWRLGGDGFEVLRRREVPEPLVQLVIAMVREDVEQRLRDVPAVLAALEAALSDEATQPDPAATLEWHALDDAQTKAWGPAPAARGDAPTLRKRAPANDGGETRKQDDDLRQHTLVEPGPGWLPWAGGGTALLALVLLSAFLLRGPSLSMVDEGSPELRSMPGTAFMPAGAFFYGPEDRKVVLSAFAIDKHEVTLGQWRACMRADGWPCPDISEYYAMIGGIERASEDEPLQFVNWQEAMAHCAWKGSQMALTGGAVGRLPTDAEWERAARGPSKPGRTYPHGDTFDKRPFQGDRLPPAGSTAVDRTPEGVMDLTASVEEWVLDSRAAEAKEGRDLSYPSPAGADPVGVGAASARAVRGGSQEGGGYDETFYRSQGRQWKHASRRSSGRGFRCAYGPPRATE